MNKQELIKKHEGKFSSIGMNLSTTIKFEELWDDILELDEQQKVTVPQFVVDAIEDAREYTSELEQAFQFVWWNDSDEFTEWFGKKSNRDVFARAWLDGYEVEKEKRYLVKVKGVNEYGCYLNKGLLSKEYFLESKAEIGGCRTKHTRKQLEDDDFGWVFDCPGIEIEEVE